MLKDCREQLDLLSIKIKRPKNNIHSSLKTYVPTTFKFLYDLADMIYSQDQTITKDGLFNSYLPLGYTNSLVAGQGTATMQVITSLKAQITLLTQQLEQTRTENLSNSARLTELKTENQDFNERIRIQTEDNVYLDTRVKQLQAQLQCPDQLTEVITKFNEQLGQTRTQNSLRITHLVIENQDIAQRLRIQVQKSGKFESRVSQLQTQIQTLQKTLRDKDTHIAQLQLQVKCHNYLKNGVVQKLDSQLIELMLRKACQNKNQKEDDRAKLHHTSLLLKDFDSEQDLLETLPKDALKTFDLFIQRHGFFRPWLHPSQDNHINYPFSMDKAVVNGPFGDETCLQVESDEPKFYLKWEPNDHTYLAAGFFDSNGEVMLYCIVIRSSEVWLRDCTSNKLIHEYKVNSDGSLGEKTI